MRNSSTAFFYTSIISGLICLLGGLGCKQQPDAKPATGSAAQIPEGRQRITVGATPLFVEVVQTDEERMRGLMFRAQLPEDQGMLFVFEVARLQSFWMRNTFIPLDIAFIASDGKIVDIQHMVPLDESKSYVSVAPAQYVLEVNAGWFARHGVKVGEVVRF
ncbi:MAG: DUF192 domain-containing protein [candidate division KSB1 bacterium]|nr:DUF192 domain-containing protein [candidate division KSB1 bacterium]MDZ7273341.1 DUF192 domain-containing protein [candidate division KSB1 bacterium]MDZ7288003.1 DUF192 domain-containing protein [candidate division KSB1 bacterium]MDZ7300145.1 DUF192 domain-containing protein [candidate division KSB1 bacterium]MDZ7308467.1 DUF192 domain-containing protein [candidate division KSB1 bacterium]